MIDTMVVKRQRPTNQLDLWGALPFFPSTRYQGSKLKITEWLWENIKHIGFETVLDAFGGTGCVSHMLKSKFKEVTYNDILNFNFQIGKGLVENSHEQLSKNEIEMLLTRHNHFDYKTVIQDNFKDIYFTDEENVLLDVVAQNIFNMKDSYRKNIAYFSLFQSCIIKRPYNLFHRKNLYVRTADVERNFGNKTTWDTPFEVYFKKFADEANQAIFENGKNNRAVNFDVFDISGKFDLVYIDTPYISQNGVGVNYHDFYHFLEGMVQYPSWQNSIDYKSKHRRLMSVKNVWNDKKAIYGAFDKLFAKYQNSTLVISYRSDGIPSVKELEELLKKYKKEVLEISKVGYKYVLSNRESQEVLIIGK